VQTALQVDAERSEWVEIEKERIPSTVPVGGLILSLSGIFKISSAFTGTVNATKAAASRFRRLHAKSFAAFPELG
jgi:hypothetical protein